MTELEIQWLGLAVMAAALASIHLWFPWFDTHLTRHETRWMGFIGGVATCYVILYMLPKVARITTHLVGMDDAAEMHFSDLRMYYVLLTGIVVYLLMVHLDTSEYRWRLLAKTFDYGVHGTYSFLVGYVFVELSSQHMNVNVLIALILGLHLIGITHLLRAHHPEGYDRRVRWVFCLVVLIGAGLALTTELPEAWINAVTAFLAGIILVNVVSEELPLQYQPRVPWYLCGIVFYLAASYLIMFIDPPSAY